MMGEHTYNIAQGWDPVFSWTWDMSGQLTRSGQVHIPLPPRAPQLLPQQQCTLLLQEEVLTLPTLETCHSHWHFCLELAPHCWSTHRNMAELNPLQQQKTAVTLSETQDTLHHSRRKASSISSHVLSSIQIDEGVDNKCHTWQIAFWVSLTQCFHILWAWLSFLSLIGNVVVPCCCCCCQIASL